MEWSRSGTRRQWAALRGQAGQSSAVQMRQIQVAPYCSSQANRTQPKVPLPPPTPWHRAGRQPGGLLSASLPSAAAPPCQQLGLAALPWKHLHFPAPAVTALGQATVPTRWPPAPGPALRPVHGAAKEASPNRNRTLSLCASVSCPYLPLSLRLVYPVYLTGRPGWPEGSDSGVPFLSPQRLCEARTS